MDINQIKENKLKFILQFSIPSIISMLLQTAITITDAFFTGNYVGENALAAINLGLPILYFFLGIGLCVGVGGSVISGRLLGKQNSKKASEVFSQPMITSAVYCIATSALLAFRSFNGIVDNALGFFLGTSDFPFGYVFTVHNADDSASYYTDNNTDYNTSNHSSETHLLFFVIFSEK